MQPDTFDLFSDLSGSLYAVTSECHGDTVQRAVRLLRSPCTDMVESLTGDHGDKRGGDDVAWHCARCGMVTAIGNRSLGRGNCPSCAD